jgi:SAM-dependent methyltransferase
VSDLKGRLAELSPEKRKLLEMLARQKAAAPAAPVEKPKATAPVAPIVEDRWFNLDPGVFADKGDVRDLYDTVTTQLNAGEFGQHSIFLNWGYVPNQDASYSQVVLPDKTMNKNPTRLVLEVIGDVPLGPADTVLDVACGRGGTVSVLRTYFDVGRVSGLDLSPAAIAFCTARHRYPDTHFVAGDSESLPFADGSMSLVTNLESSHCYPHIERFYREVFRVLRPGGHFCYTDVLPTTRVAGLEALLGEVGLVMERRRDITSNVLLSCDDIARNHARMFEGNNTYVMGNFLAVPGSRLYNDMMNGVHTYLLYKLRKP